MLKVTRFYINLIIKLASYKQLLLILSFLSGRKVNEVTIVVLGLAKSGKTTLVTELSKATSKLKIKYNFLDPCSGNFSEEDVNKELSYSDQVILVVDPMKEFKKDYPNKNFHGYGFLTYHLGFKDIIICVNKVVLV